MKGLVVSKIANPQNSALHLPCLNGSVTLENLKEIVPEQAVGLIHYFCVLND